MSEYSKACCRIPPIVSEGYEPKGQYTELDGLKTYVTGPECATTGIILFYDVFGFFPQTLQGADILAYANSEKPSRVFVPDFLKGNAAKIEWYPPDTEEKKATSQAWIKETLAPAKHLELFAEVLDVATKENNNITSWGVIGYCYGGKMVSLIAGQDKNIKAAIQSSPAMVDPSDAEKVKIPMMLLASKDEPVEAVQKFEENLTSTKHVETFGDQVHGWMSARADLRDERVRSEFERGYKAAVDFFNKHL